MGSGCATSLKAAIVEHVPRLMDSAGFREARRLLTQQMGGASALREELTWAGFVESDGRLNTDSQTCNVFARYAVGEMTQPGMDAEQALLGEYEGRFMVCSNKPVCDAHWDSNDPDWVGKASMSRRHRFLTTRDIHWQWFNALVFGLVAPEDGGTTLMQASAEVEAMKSAAIEYCAAAGGWSTNIGLYVHVFGHNSVNSLHVHILDMDELGPSFEHFSYKNCPLDAVLKVMREELSALSQPSKMPARAMTCPAPVTPRLSFEEPKVSGQKSGKPAAPALPDQQPPAPSKAIGRGSSGSSCCSVTTGKAFCPLDAYRQILELNVSGKIVSVSQTTILQAPHGSLLRTMLTTGIAGEPARPRDAQGRLFVDLPATSFEAILDRLRLRQLATMAAANAAASGAPSVTALLAPDLESAPTQEFRWLAAALGVEELVVDGCNTKAPADCGIYAGGRSQPRRQSRLSTKGFWELCSWCC